MNPTLACIGRLLDYPEREQMPARAEAMAVIGKDGKLPEALRVRLAEAIKYEGEDDLYEIQARYDGLFDRGRSLSLLLFEHVHGQSRDRGQAMVDLLDVYHEAGLVPLAGQLPDYLPLFLEFLAVSDGSTRARWLNNIAPILRLLRERLSKREAWEADLMTALLVLADAPLHDAAVTEQVREEADDSTLAALDREWEDKEIRFDGALESACPANTATASNGEHPLTWHPPKSRHAKLSQEAH